MYKIIICDDEIEEIKKINSLLETYRKENLNFQYVLKIYLSGSDILKEIEENSEAYDLILLDIYLKEETGTQIAKHIREKGYDGPIIFITTSLHHGLEAFEVDATQYIVKPVEKKKLFFALEKAFRVRDERHRFINIKIDAGKIKKVMMRDIIYSESHGNYQHIHTINGEELKTRITLKELKTIFQKETDFIALGSAFIINLSHVDNIGTREITMSNNKIIGIPRGLYQEIKDRYFSFYCGLEGY